MTNQPLINGVTAYEIKIHPDYGRRSEADIARKILRDNRKNLFVPVFENIKKHFDNTIANDSLEITYLDNGLNIDIMHNRTKDILGEYQSLLRIECIGDEYHYYIMIYDNNGKDSVALDGKTTDVDKMITDIKNVYNWD